MVGLFNKINRQLRPWHYFKKIEAKQSTRIKKNGIIVFSKEAEKLLDAYARNLVIIVIFGLLVLLFCVYVFEKIFFPSFGKNIHLDFYTTLAQILPALLIALFLAGPVDYKLQSQQHLDRLKRSVWHRLTLGDRLFGIVGFIAGELACLSAIARGSTGTGLFILSLFGAGILAVVLIQRISNRL
jgi:Na+/H+ antiporter NhaD/arsenite permease-like protein